MRVGQDYRLAIVQEVDDSVMEPFRAFNTDDRLPIPAGERRPTLRVHLDRLDCLGHFIKERVAEPGFCLLV